MNKEPSTGKTDRKLEAHDLAQNKVRKGTRKEDNCAPSLSFLWPLLSGTHYSTQGFNLISESDIGEPKMSSHSSVPSNATQRTKLKARSYLIGNRKGSSLAGKQKIGDIELLRLDRSLCMLQHWLTLKLG